MSLRRIRTPVEQLQPFEQGRNVGLREAGWTYQWIAAHVGHNVLVECRCVQQWSVKHSHTRRPSSGRPHSTDPRQDRHIGRTTMAAASKEEIRAQVAPAMSPRTTGNSLLAAGLRQRVPLTMLPLTSRHRQARLLWCRERVDWRLEWRSIVFSDESRCCLYASDGLTHVR